MKQAWTLFSIIWLLAAGLNAQDCDNHHLEGDCRFDLQKGYNLYSQSTSVTMSPLDTTELSMIFYGQKDYILSFCTHRKMYPIHFMLIDEQTDQLLYDNQEDKFIESVGLGFDVSKTIRVKITVLARESTEQEIEENIGCVGVLVQYKNYPFKKVNIKM